MSVPRVPVLRARSGKETRQWGGKVFGVGGYKGHFTCHSAVRFLSKTFFGLVSSPAALSQSDMLSVTSDRWHHLHRPIARRIRRSLISHGTAPIPATGRLVSRNSNQLPPPQPQTPLRFHSCDKLFSKCL